jgi:hypothetical protein
MPIDRIKAFQKHADLALLIQQAREALPEFTAFVKDIATEFQCDYVVGDVKTEASANKKSEKTKQSYDAIVDYDRAMIIVEDHELEKIRAIAQKYHPAVDSRIKGFRDCISHYFNGFKALLIHPEMANGIVGEIMILSRSMYNTYERTHPMHERVGQIQALYPDPDTRPQEAVDEIAGIIRQKEAIFLQEVSQQYRDLSL